MLNLVLMKPRLLSGYVRGLNEGKKCLRIGICSAQCAVYGGVILWSGADWIHGVCCLCGTLGCWKSVGGISSWL
jgi:hypothetical protein